MNTRRRAPGTFLLLLSTVVAVSTATGRSSVWQEPAAPGGFLETAESTIARPVPTAAEIAAFVPATRGPFTFPAPYRTAGVRVTTAADCAGAADCVNYVGYSYWQNMNNSAGSNFLYLFLGLDKNRGGAGPTLFRYDKTTGETVTLGPLFAGNNRLSSASAEGWYFSATQPTSLYIPNWQQLLRYDVLAHTSSVVFDVSSQFGEDKYIWQVHSSHDDRVHSFTLKNQNTFDDLGCATYREDTRQFDYFPAHGYYDECQIDKSGRWLLIKEDVDGKDGVDNRIINLDTGVETVLLDPDGAGGHSDNGFGSMVASDNMNNLPNAIRRWVFTPPPLPPGPVIYSDPKWIPESVSHLSFTNARSAPFTEQYSCGSAANRVNGPRANEVVCFRLDGSLTTMVLAPVMTDLDAAGGGADDYSKTPKGNLDPTGQYFIWTSNLMGGRLDAFVVRVPSSRLVTPPADITAPAIAISAPAQAATVSGTVTISAAASDNVGVAGVQFSLDGAALGGELTAAPYAVTWNTATCPSGAHVLSAVARDAAGNTTVAPAIRVTVQNTASAPLVSGVTASDVTSSSAIIEWTTDQLTDTRVEYGSTTAYGHSTPAIATLSRTHVQGLSGLTAGATYHYRVLARNAAGVVTTSGDAVLTAAARAR